MNIVVCNVGNVPDAAISRAEAEAATIFSLVGVGIAWTSYADDRSNPELITRIFLRLRREALAGKSFDAMGYAFAGLDLSGEMADAHYGEIEAFAECHLADSGEILGYVVAHEIGTCSWARTLYSWNHVQRLDQGNHHQGTAGASHILTHHSAL